MMKRRQFLKAGAISGLVAAACQTQEDPAAEQSQGAAQAAIQDLPDLTSGLQPIPVDEFQFRLEKARRLMTEHGFDAFYAESGATLEYFTGVTWGRSERMFAVVLPRNGELAFVCPAFEESRARERIRFSDADIRVWEEDESPYDKTVGILKDRNIASGRVAVDPATRFFLITGLQKASSGIDFVDGTAVSDGCRMTKTELELEYMRLSNEITKRAYGVAIAGLEEGMTEADFSNLISRAHRQLGAPGGAMVLFGPNSALPHGSKNRKQLEPGDVVLMDGGCSVNGYRSDVTRTLVFGEPTEKQKEAWQIVYDAQTAAFEAAKPGVPCGELDHIARQVVDKAGYGKGYEYFTHRLGHGIGLEGHESPYLVKGNDLPMEPGMTFSNEPGIYIPGEWGIRHEDIMVVTEEGAEMMGLRTHSIRRPVASSH